jgi:hypothetical protein
MCFRSPAWLSSQIQVASTSTDHLMTVMTDRPVELATFAKTLVQQSAARLSATARQTGNKYHPVMNTCLWVYCHNNRELFVSPGQSLVYSCLIPSVNMVVRSRHYSNTRLDGLRNNTKNLNLNNGIPYRGTNLNSKEFYIRVPVPQTESSVSCFQVEFIAWKGSTKCTKKLKHCLQINVYY